MTETGQGQGRGRAEQSRAEQGQGQVTDREGAVKAARAEQGQGHDQRTETRQGRIRTGAEDRDRARQDRAGLDRAGAGIGQGSAMHETGQGRVRAW